MTLFEKFSETLLPALVWLTHPKACRPFICRAVLQ